MSLAPLLGCRLLSGRGFALCLRSSLSSLSLGLSGCLLPSGLGGGGLDLGGGLLLVLNRLGLGKKLVIFNFTIKYEFVLEEISISL